MEITEKIKLACDIATGKIPADPNDKGYKIIGAKKDLNSRGRGPQWYRMVHRNGSWQYVSNERLPAGTFSASERRAHVSGQAFIGEIIVQHDRGKPIDLAYIITGEGGEYDPKTEITFHARRDGNLVFVLPDNSEIILSNPRK